MTCGGFFPDTALQHSGVVCVNKWDLNPGMTAQIEETARQGRGVHPRADPSIRPFCCNGGADAGTGSG